MGDRLATVPAQVFTDVDHRGVATSVRVKELDGVWYVLEVLTLEPPTINA